LYKTLSNDDFPVIPVSRVPQTGVHNGIYFQKSLNLQDISSFVGGREEHVQKILIYGESRAKLLKNGRYTSYSGAIDAEGKVNRDMRENVNMMTNDKMDT